MRYDAAEGRDDKYEAYARAVVYTVSVLRCGLNVDVGNVQSLRSLRPERVWLVVVVGRQVGRHQKEADFCREAHRLQTRSHASGSNSASGHG